MAGPNVTPAAFAVPAQGQVGLSPYGRAIVNLGADIQDCWPCDDPANATSLRNLRPAGIRLDTFSAIVKPGQPSMLHNDPNGRSVMFYNGAAYHAAAYNMPAVGTLEWLMDPFFTVATDGPFFGNWNGNHVMVTIASPGVLRYYMNATFANQALVAADLKDPLHVCVTWDGTTERLYLNGVQRSTQAVGSPSAAGGFMGVGVYSSAVHAVFCRNQWMTVYKRPLTPAEVASHAALIVSPS